MAFRMIAALTLAFPAMAQVGTSTLTGRIPAATSLAVPDVEVRVVNEASGATVTVHTNDDGIYRATALLPGIYRLEARLDGFDPLVKNLVVEVAQVVAADFALRVGQQNLT